MLQTSLFTTKYVTFHVTVRVPTRRDSNIASLTTPSIPCGRSTPGTPADGGCEGKSSPRVHSRDSETAESVRRMTHQHSSARKKRTMCFDAHNMYIYSYVTLVRRSKRLQRSAKHTSRARERTRGCSNNTVKLLVPLAAETRHPRRLGFIHKYETRHPLYIHTCDMMTLSSLCHSPVMMLLSFKRNLSTNFA